MKTRTFKIYLIFFIYLILFMLNFCIRFVDSATSGMWFILSLFSTILAIILLVMYRLPNKRYIFISLILACLVYISYMGYGYFISFEQISGFISTFIASMAVFQVFDVYKENALRFIRNASLKSVVLSIIIGIIVGAIWGTLNYFLMVGSNKADPRFSVSWIILALSPAILEEIVYRTLFYAFCLHILKGAVDSRAQKFACLFMMIVPHVLAHTPEYFITGGFAQGLFSTILLIVLFGLPFALLQKKRDVLSAMIAHGTVDAIRFIIFGI